MTNRHGRENFLIKNEGVYREGTGFGAGPDQSTSLEDLRKFRFSRMRPQQPGDANGGDAAAQKALFQKLALAMTEVPGAEAPTIPAGFTYLGQFIDHDLTQDNTKALLGDQVNVEDLIQGRSPMLDLDSLYGLGPNDARDRRFYQSDGVRLKVGTTQQVPPADAGGNQPPIVRQDLDGFDLPRVGFGSTKRDRRQALIPDLRNDENLAVAQIHLAFIRFHNAVVLKLAEQSSLDLFDRAREKVVKHYQWIILHEFLPKLIDENVLQDVLKNGRRFFEVPSSVQHANYGAAPPARNPNADYEVRLDPYATMPIEFSVAAYRLGHSMIRASYEWNEVFRTGGLVPGSLELLLRFSGTSGNLSPPPSVVRDSNDGHFERLPTNWVADFRRLFDFAPHANGAPLPKVNSAMALNTAMVNPLAALPPGSFGDPEATVPPIEANLAFRNLTRGGMVNLASGQQMAAFFQLAPNQVLTAGQVINGNGGAKLGLSDAERTQLTEHTPLWFYILREAEFSKDGKLGPVGSRIVAETFHRSIETSTWSIVRDPSWRPDLGRDGTFEMTDLLLLAYGGVAGLAPLG